MDKLLIDEHPLILLPSLAAEIGLHEAIIIQQLHYWIEHVGPDGRRYGKVVDGKRWIRNSVADWQRNNFPFLTTGQVYRALKSLEKQGLIESRDDLNETGYDRTKWYTIDYDALRQREIHFSLVKNGFSTSENTIPETTTETTTESTAHNGAGTTDEGAERGGAAGQKSAKRKRKAPADIPAPIAIYRKWTNLYPKKPLWGKITATVSDLDLWSRVVENWVASGWNPRNLSGMLEYYQRGEVPGTARSRQSHAQPERPAPRDAKAVIEELGL